MSRGFAAVRSTVHCARVDTQPAVKPWGLLIVLQRRHAHREPAGADYIAPFRFHCLGQGPDAGHCRFQHPVLDHVFKVTLNAGFQVSALQESNNR